MNIKIKKFLLETLKTFSISLLIVLLVQQFVMKSVRVDGSSMYPNLKHGDFGLSFIISKNLSVNRFDIVVVSSVKTENKLVKRVIGLPNETIEYRNNHLYINGVKTEENFLKDTVFTPDFQYVLAEDEYFVLGDNREVSRDSRYYGSFSFSEILSTHVFVLWPIANFGYKK